MLRQRFLVLLPAVVLMACDQASTTAPLTAVPAPPPAAPAVLEYTGVIENSLGDLDPLYLRVPGGPRIRLAGGETARLARVIGAEVSVRGTLDGIDGMIVEAFLVLSVGGRAAADGVLLKVGDDFFIRLLIDGSMRLLINPPDELKDHVGERVWVTGPDDAAPVAYGVIGGTT